MSHPFIESARVLLRTLMNAHTFSKSAIESVIGVPFVHDGEAQPEQRHYRANTDGAFARVDFREPNATQTQGWRLIVLYVRDGVDLPMVEIGKDLIPPGLPPRIEPAPSAEGAIIFTVERPGQSVRFEFGADTRRLRIVTLERDRADA